MATRPLINQRGIRQFILDHAKRSRAHRYTQVADSVYDVIEAAVREKCRQIVHAQPSAGRTIR